MGVSIRSYGRNGPRWNAMAVKVGKLTLFFSYETVIGFQEEGKAVVVCENCWGNTTGKHICLIGGQNPKDRLPREQFDKKLEAVLKAHKLI